MSPHFSYSFSMFHSLMFLVLFIPIQGQGNVQGKGITFRSSNVFVSRKGMGWPSQSGMIFAQRKGMVYWVRHGLCISLSPPQLCVFSLSGFPPWLLIVRHCLYFYSDILFSWGMVTLVKMKSYAIFILSSIQYN